MRDRSRLARSAAVLLAGALGLVIAPLPAGAQTAAEAPAVPVRLTLYVRDATGAAVPAAQMKVHVSRLADDLTLSAEGTASFRLVAGAYTLDTIKGRRCRHSFKVTTKPIDLALIVPASGSTCEPATAEALRLSDPGLAKAASAAP